MSTSRRSTGMNSAIGSRTPPPRLVDIKSTRPQSMGPPSFINPRLLSRRQMSRPHNHGLIDTVSELRRVNSPGTKSRAKITPHQPTSQGYGFSDTIPPKRERGTMKDLSDFLMSYDPPAHNLVAPPQATARKRFGLLRRKQKREPKPNQFLKLPDTAIAAKTRQGVQYIAISIPLEHDYLGKTQTPPEPASRFERAPALDRVPVVVHKPVYDAGQLAKASHDPPMLGSKTSISKRSTWGPGTLTKVITKPGSEEIVLQMDIFSELVRVVNRTPSPDVKSTHQTHKIVKSISTIHSVATTGTGIRQSLQSRPDSINTNSSMPAVFGTAETIDLHNFRGTTARPSLQSEKIVQLPAVGSAEPGNGLANQATRPIAISSPNSSQSGSSEKPADQTIKTSLREKVRARKERDLASLGFGDSNLDKIATNEIYTQSFSEKSPKTEVGPSSPSSSSSKSIALPARSTERPSRNAVVLATPDIMLVADLPPYFNHVHQSDIPLPRPISHVPAVPSPSRLPRPKFTLSRPLQSLDEGNSTYTHHSTQTILTHTRPSPQFQKACHARLSNIDMDTVQEREIGPRSSRERELETRMRIIERDTDVLLSTLAGIVKSFDGLGQVARLRWEGVNGRDRGVRSSVIGIDGVAREESNGKMFGSGERNVGNRRRAATTGMGMGMGIGMEDRDMDLVMRGIHGPASNISNEFLKVRGR
ncbi:756ff0c0-806b-46b9-a6b3-8dc792daca37 [Sclerotinia trifoliorum]|uniref:756ff0c0-806b-46b9-a6b3-8dc792daca37 n=1 Tax=Sclerotinia trifoliorum TaxID=28548 RepID=A0A8H2VWV2_9HELO|nr:756ff0c0-806b-46b9-a6b3-8dc792daca37 [Sclerotinia trifoliorum]